MPGGKAKGLAEGDRTRRVRASGRVEGRVAAMTEALAGKAKARRGRWADEEGDEEVAQERKPSRDTN